MKSKELVEFTYTKADGSTSERTLFVISPPNKMLFGIDLSEYADDVNTLSNLHQQLTEIYKRKQKEIDAEVDALDLAFKYRQFKEEGITEK